MSFDDVLRLVFQKAKGDCVAAPEESPTPAGAPRPLRESGTVVLVVDGPISPADISALCRRVRALLEGRGGTLVVLDVGALAAPDAVTIDALARMRLTARRLGCEVRLCRAPGELGELLDLMGLSGVLPCVDLPVEPIGQPEQRKDGSGIQEEGDPRDPGV
jgi:anti-anti-sigma regulatory factor